jgi:hypothetical protein
VASGLIGIIGILMLAAGILIFILGWRGRPALSLPRCTACGYDLRGQDPQRSSRCPECGGDLASANAVSFGKFQKRPRMMLLGGAMALLPLLLLGVSLLQAAMGIQWSDYRSNRSVIAHVSETVDPSDWMELDRRLAKGKLSAQDVTAAIDQLITHLNSLPQKGQSPLVWCDSFVGRVDSGGLISDEQYARLSDAFYGKDPAITGPARICAGQPWRFDIKYGGGWNLPNMKLIKALAGAELGDGRKLELNKSNTWGLSAEGPFPLQDGLALPAEPGDYKVTLHVDLGIVPQVSRYATSDGRPGPAKLWPPARRKWSKDVTANVTVFAPQPATLVEDPAQDPVAQGLISVESLRVLPGAGQEAIEINFRCSPCLAMYFDLEIRLGEQSFGMGTVQKVADLRGTFGTRNSFQRVGPGVTATVLLRPNAHAAGISELKAIWGKEIEFKEVPVQRLDLVEPGQ